VSEAHGDVVRARNVERGDDDRDEMTEQQNLLALIVDDDDDFRASVAALVRREGFETRLAGSLEEARKSMSDESPDLVLVDLQLPDGHGLELLDDTLPASDTEFVVVTGNGGVDTAVHAMREGALDYLAKPFDPAKVSGVLANVARTRGLKRELNGLRWQLRKLGRFGKLVGSSPPMQEVYNLIARVAPTTATVLLVGESGTGKELVAETLHALSRRKDKPLFAVNCGAVSPNLIESELFGHEKGSFTGADRRHIGYFERAAGGTLMLDEITEMGPELQVKLLRVLESGHFLRVGGNDPIECDVRIVAATNRSPEEAVASGKLREDLYYRLNVFTIQLPPLRDRGDDIQLLAQHFLDELNAVEQTNKRWAPEGLHALAERPWRGNVRELRNVVHQAFILADRDIRGESISAFEAPARNGKPVAVSDDGQLHVSVGTEIAAVEKQLILATLEHFEGDKKKAAQTLGISLKTLYNRLSVYRASNGAAPS
jgi:two-component system, NtrC family, response regulator HydG